MTSFSWSSVSVVVAVRGNACGLPSLLRSLARQDYAGPLEVIVVDNHDRPVINRSDFVAWPIPVHVVYERRPGLSPARNTGIRVATGDFILITDPEAQPDPTWVRTMVIALRCGGADLVGGRVVPTLPAGVGPLPAPVLALFGPTCWPTVVCELEEPWDISGSNLGMPNTDELLRLFDTHHAGPDPRHRHCGASDLSASTRAAGGFVQMIPAAVVHRPLRPEHLAIRSVWARAWWQGTSLARLDRSSPGAHLPRPRARWDLPWAWLVSRGGWLAIVTVLARAGGRTTERALRALGGRRRERLGRARPAQQHASQQH